MAITKKAAREALARTIGAWLPGAASSNGNAGGTTVVDSAFIGGAEMDNAYRGYYLLLTSGTLSASGVTPVFRRVTSFAAATGTFTVTGAFAGQVASGVTFELHSISPELFTEALNKPRAVAWQYLFKPLYDSSITLTQGDYEYTMPTGILPEMISRVMMEGGETGDTYDGIPDPRLLPKDIATYSADGAKIWLNRGKGAKSVDVITGRLLYLVGKNYLTAFAKDTTRGALVTDTTAGAELTENTPPWVLFMKYAAAELYLLVASGPMVQNRQEILALAKAWREDAEKNTPLMRMREADWDAGTGL